MNLQFYDFIPFVDGSKQRRKDVTTGEPNIPFLESIKLVEFRKGSRLMYYKKTLSNDSSYEECDFLKKKFSLDILKPYETPAGINSQKKEKIISTLCKSMPARKQPFWTEMPANSTAKDLCQFNET